MKLTQNELQMEMKRLHEFSFNLTITIHEVYVDVGDKVDKIDELQWEKYGILLCQ